MAKNGGPSGEKNQDRLSNLPTELRVSILNLLPLKSRVRTSVLSKVWESEWNFCTVLDFDPRNLSKKRNSAYVLPSYVNWVNWIIEDHAGEHIEMLRVCKQLGENHTETIDGWIDMAVGKQVKRIVLDLGANCFHDFHQYHCQLAARKVNKIEELIFKNVEIADDDILFAVKNMTHLKRLHVLMSNTLKNICIEDNARDLTELLVASCPSMATIHISRSNIKQFTFSGHPIDLRLSKVPLLVGVSLFERDIDEQFHDQRELIFSQLSSCLPQLHSLTLDLRFMLSMQVFPIPSLPHLRALELNVLADEKMVIGQLHTMLKAAPNLKKLVLKIQLGWRSNIGFHDSTLDDSKHQVERIELKGYDVKNLNARRILAYLQDSIISSVLLIDGVAP